MRFKKWTPVRLKSDDGAYVQSNINVRITVLRTYPKYSDINFMPYLILNLNKAVWLPIDVSKTAGWVANSVDPDSTLFTHISLSEYFG